MTFSNSFNLRGDIHLPVNRRLCSVGIVQNVAGLAVDRLNSVVIVFFLPGILLSAETHHYLRAVIYGGKFIVISCYCYLQTYRFFFLCVIESVHAKFEMEPILPHQIFNGLHYPAWKIRIRHEIEYAQECPLALQPLPDMETAAQLRTRTAQENKAMGALARHLGNDVIGLIDRQRTVRNAFVILDQHYGTPNVTNALALQAKLDAMHLDFKVDPVAFFVEVDRIIAQLGECGINTSDTERSIRYIATVPSSMKTIRHSVRGLISISGYTSAMTKSTIMQELTEMKKEFHLRNSNHCSEGNGNESRRPYNRFNHQNVSNGSRETKNGNGESNPTNTRNGNGNGSNGGAAFPAIKGTFLKQGKKIVKCFLCDQKGHYANKCPLKTAKTAIMQEQSDADKFAIVSIAGDAKINELPQGYKNSNFMGDSGANYHMINSHEECLINPRPLNGNEAIIRIAKAGVTMRAKVQGDLKVLSRVGTVIIEDC